MRNQKGTTRRKRGRPALGRSVQIKVRLRPAALATLRGLAELRGVSCAVVVAHALDRLFASLGAEPSDEAAEPSDEAAARRWVADRSAAREIERLSMGVPKS